MVSKRALILATTIFLGFIAIGFGLWQFDRFNENDDKRLRRYAAAAESVGLVRAKEECLKEALQKDVCESLKATTDTTECSGKTCWIVYAQSSGPEYAASVTVNDQNGKYVVIDYLRNTGTQE